MQFAKGADVFTADGEKAGQVDRVVIDPKTNEVTHIVVEKGFLFREEKVVPVSLVEKTTEGRVDLSLIDDLEGLPPLVDEHYVSMLDAGEPYGKGVYWYPPHGSAWWHPSGPYPVAFGYPEPPYVIRTEEYIPEDTVALEEGAKVITNDGEHVGDVERVFADPDSDRATHFVISRGFLLTEEKVVPTTWVKDIEEEEVRLAVGARLIDALPAYEE